MPISRALLWLFTAGFGAGALHAQETQIPGGGELFPQPFVVEHQMIQDDGDGSVFTGEPVTDYYGGSWIVSVRPDGSRMVLDLARREIVEIHPEKGAYWSVSFERLAELRDRMVALEAPGFYEEVGEIPAEKRVARELGRDEFAIEETSDASPLLERGRGREKALPDKAATLVSRSGVQHLRLRARSAPADDPHVVEVWLDPRVRLTPAALTALARFDAEVLGTPRSLRGRRHEVPASSYLAAARDYGGGAFPIRTVRPLPIRPDVAVLPRAGDPRIGTLEDVASRLETLDRFPLELVEVPDGLRETSHPYEAVVTFLEKDQALRRGEVGAER